MDNFKRIAPQRKSAGYTFLEGMLVIAMVGIVAATATPLYITFQNRSALDIAATSIRSSIVSAQRLSQSVGADVNWSVHVGTGSVALYPGTVYAPEAAGLSYTFPTNITITGPTDVAFAKFTGRPASAVTYVLRNSQNATRTITINTVGTINVQ